MSEEKCGNCKRVKEHVATVLPFQVLEKITDRPVRIRGVAMCMGMSRNLNIYTSEELQAFSSKLANAPVYIEHVAVPNAVGKVTKTDWDGHNLWYEAEIYDDQTAEKIRKGLIQHVSVGADYEAVDLVDGKVPHGLHNAELSLVAVPGIPETNINVLEALLQGTERKVVKAGSCVFCGKPANYLVSSCKECFGKFPAGQEPQNGKEKALEKLVTQAVEKGNSEIKTTREKLAETESKLATSEKTLIEANRKLSEAEKSIEQSKAAQQANGLIKEQPKTITITEAIAVLERLLPVPTVERSTLGMQRECQAIRAAIHSLQERLT